MFIAPGKIVKLSDFVIHFFAEQGVTQAFLVSGGAVIHLVDSVSRHPSMNCVCSQHEQNAAASADMYARVSKGIGLALSTSGPGASNMTTSICNAYFDSIPLVCVTGQVSRPRLRKTTKLRQRGFQETDIVSLFKDISKYVVLVTDPQQILYELEKALYLATSGRPGPVIIDIPDDLQREEIDPSTLKHYTPPFVDSVNGTLQRDVHQLFSLINQASKPVLILGAGVHIANVEDACSKFVEKLGMPTTLTWGGADLLTADNPYNRGCVGVCGPRGGNFALHHSDLVIAIGTRLSQLITGGKQNLFAPHAKKVMVDIDPYELQKFDTETFTLDLPICCDLADFFDCAAEEPVKNEFSKWLAVTEKWKQEFLLESFDQTENRKVNPHFFVTELSRFAEQNSIIIGDTGANLAWTCQHWKFKKGQHIHSAWNHTPMGFALPASIGASFASSKRPIYCLIGDGGLMMCLQELATVKRYELPIRIFIFNNAGHSIQKQTIEVWLNSRYTAVDHDSGLCFPDYEKLAEAFGINYYAIKTNNDVNKLKALASSNLPFLCNVEIDPKERIVPMLKFGKGLEDLNPPLPLEIIERIKEEATSIEYIGKQ